MRVGLALVVALATCAPCFAEDEQVSDCAEVGKLILMLNHMDGICEKYELTDAGRNSLADLTAQSILLGGKGGKVCIDKGKISMGESLLATSPTLAQLAGSGSKDREANHSAICDAVAKYLDMLSTQGGGPKLFQSSGHSEGGGR